MKKLGFISTLLLISGCATIFTGTSQNLGIRVVDADTNSVIEKSKCTLFDGEGMTHTISNGEGSVIVQKGKGSLKIECKSGGYKQKSISVSQNFNAVTVANVLFWPGIIVDAVTGAMQKYPPHAIVQMEKL